MFQIYSCTNIKNKIRIPNSFKDESIHYSKMRQKLPILVYPDLVSGVFYIFIHRDCGESGLFMFCVYKLSIIPSDSPMVGTIIPVAFT